MEMVDVIKLIYKEIPKLVDFKRQNFFDYKFCFEFNDFNLHIEGHFITGEEERIEEFVVYDCFIQFPDFNVDIPMKQRSEIETQLTNSYFTY